MSKWYDMLRVYERTSLKLLTELPKKAGRIPGHTPPYCLLATSAVLQKFFFLSIYIQLLKINSAQTTKLLHSI